ncbi:hypothetical protein AGABI1DRAFT_106151 [Agaricus bisporus var. burnettii JB137-S8]|uniref:Uncharacterized protein n=1 Tax=Agaricus bisporus var. burnettii (strain JB137-S8 / ATCC MYA-4627 / FGSC 10392) TaxID=597362 RepID=K5X9R5_AGABU|nr:uncharacterized protein AGABI1DRAFT_106151 [Agaricus bisporus var. burnettii JB137-S8]EKM79777.1 hypothetical protein AGABI1DRAFT_106151 [Agaricus bisporus var. burnettii JB137-S8]
MDAVKTWNGENFGLVTLLIHQAGIFEFPARSILKFTAPAYDCSLRSQPQWCLWASQAYRCFQWIQKALLCQESYTCAPRCQCFGSVKARAHVARARTEESSTSRTVGNKRPHSDFLGDHSAGPGNKRRHVVGPESDEIFNIDNPSGNYDYQTPNTSTTSPSRPVRVAEINNRTLLLRWGDHLTRPASYPQLGQATNNLEDNELGRNSGDVLATYPMEYTDEDEVNDEGEAGDEEDGTSDGDSEVGEGQSEGERQDEDADEEEEEEGSGIDEDADEVEEEEGSGIDEGEESQPSNADIAVISLWDHIDKDYVRFMMTTDESLGDTDLSLLRKYVLKVEDHLTERTFERLAFAFPGASHSSLKITKKHLLYQQLRLLYWSIRQSH